MPDTTTESGHLAMGDPADVIRVPSDLEESTFLTPRELSRLVKVPPGTLGQWRHRRIGPRWLKLENGHVRYPLAAYREWIARQYDNSSA